MSKSVDILALIEELKAENDRLKKLDRAFNSMLRAQFGCDAKKILAYISRCESMDSNNCAELGIDNNLSNR